MIFNWPTLSILIFLPLIGVIFLLCMSNNNNYLDTNAFYRNVKFVALWTTSITFLGSIIIFLNFDNLFSGYQFEQVFKWFETFNVYYHVGIDGLSLSLIMLTTFLFPICIIFSWKNIKYKIKEYLILLLLLETFIIGLFSSLDLILFYIFFEFIFISIFLIVFVWGGKSRLKAFYKIIILNCVSSFLFLLAITYIGITFKTTNIQLLLNIFIPKDVQIWLFLAFISSFILKISLWKFYSFISDVNNKYPAIFLIIFISIILKISCYGILRFLIPLFPNASLLLQNYIFYLSLTGVVYSLFLCFWQINYHKLIVYYSFSHLGLIIIGIFSFNKQGLDGAMFQMISDGFVFTGLLLSLSIRDQNFKSQDVIYFGNLINFIPKFGLFFNFFIISSIGFPGTSNFIGNILVFVGTWKSNSMIMFLLLCSLIICSFFVIVFYRSIMYGVPKNYGSDKLDISTLEALALIPLVSLIFFLGLKPNFLLYIINKNSDFLITVIKNIN